MMNEDDKWYIYLIMFYWYGRLWNRVVPIDKSFFSSFVFKCSKRIVLCLIERYNKSFILFIFGEKKWEQWIRCKTFVLQLICCLCTRNHLFCFTFKRKLLSSVKLWVGNEFIIGLCHKICSQNSLLRLREEQKKEREE